MPEISDGKSKHKYGAPFDKDESSYFTMSYRPETWSAAREVKGRSAQEKNGIILMPTVPSGFAHEVLDGGVTGAIEPNWATKNGGKTTDGTVEYTAIPADSLLANGDVIATSKWRFSDNDDWAANKTLKAKQRISPTVPNGFEYDCPLGGVTGGTEPVYPTTEGDTVTDGTCELIAVYVGEYVDDSIIDNKATKVKVSGIAKNAKVLNLRNIVAVTRANGNTEEFNSTLIAKVKEL